MRSNKGPTLSFWTLRNKNEKINISKNNIYIHFLNFYRPYEERGWKCPKAPFSCDPVLSKVSPGGYRKHTGPSRHKSSVLIRAAREDFGGGGGSKERGKSASNKLTFLDNGSNKCHSIIFKLVKKPKILSLPPFIPLLFFSL